jgi:hypothetical protein
MSCERTLPLLPLLALDAAEAEDARTARAHVEECERCAASLRELVATRAALASFTVADSPSTDPAEIRSTAPAVASHFASGRGFAPRRRATWLWKAAAAVVVVGLGGAFAWTHGSVNVERGAATLSIAWGSGARPPASDFRAREDSLEPEAVALALADLERRIDQLELRHEQDLLLLAKTVDRQQESRDRGVDRRIQSLEASTHEGFLYTNSVIDGVASKLAKTADAGQH